MPAPEPAENAPRRKSGRPARFAWALYDWAADGFSAVIIAYVFSAYFTRSVAADTTSGTAQWGTALAIAGVATALAGPVAGAIADRSGPVKPWLLAATLLCAVPTAALWYVEPTTASILLALLLVGLGSFGSELSKVFYNAMLPRLAPPEQLGRLSGAAWSLGYFGGIACLGVALFGLVRTDTSLLALDRAESEHIRAVGPLVALWLVVFAAPLFVLTPDQPPSGLRLGQAVRSGLAQLRDTLRRVGAYRNLLRFLIARLVYTDGTGTLFTFGGVYAAGTFDLATSEVLVFGIALNVAGGLGAAFGGWVDDRIGARTTILLGLAGVVGCGVPLLFLEGEAMLWTFGLPLGLFLGPVQPASRSLMARLAPAGMETEMFGFFAFSGKVTAFVGPALVAWATTLADSQRAGMSVIVAFFLVGALLLLRVQAPAPTASSFR